MAAYAVGKGMDGVGQVVVDHWMAGETRLEPAAWVVASGGHPDLVDKMAGGAGHPLVEMLGLHPVNILLMVALGKFVA